MACRLQGSHISLFYIFRSIDLHCVQNCYALKIGKPAEIQGNISTRNLALIIKRKKLNSGFETYLCDNLVDLDHSESCVEKYFVKDFERFL